MPAIPTPEQVYVALFGLVPKVTWESGGKLITTSRRVKLFSDVDPSLQPALYQAEHDAIYAQKSNLPYRREFEAQWIVYNHVDDSNNSPTTDINTILGAIEAALKPVPADMGWPERNTLGGLVYHCFIDGKLLKDPGDIDNQGMLIVPIRILAP